MSPLKLQLPPTEGSITTQVFRRSDSAALLSGRGVQIQVAGPAMIRNDGYLYELYGDGQLRVDIGSVPFVSIMTLSLAAMGALPQQNQIPVDEADMVRARADIVTLRKTLAANPRSDSCDQIANAEKNFRTWEYKRRGYGELNIAVDVPLVVRAIDIRPYPEQREVELAGGDGIRVRVIMRTREIDRRIDLEIVRIRLIIPVQLADARVKKSRAAIDVQ